MINARLHGIIDYLVVIFLTISPVLFDLPEMTTYFTYSLAVIHFLLTLLTDFSLGAFKVIPFRIHGYVELVVSIALLGFAFYLGSEEGSFSRNYYIVFAIAVFIVWALTNYKTYPRTNF